MPLSTRGVSLTLLVAFARASCIEAVKWPFSPETPVPQKVKVSFDDESFSFWEPFKNTGFNASKTIIPVAQDVGRRAPGYLAYAGVATGLGLFLPPKAMTAVNIAYVAAAVARSHEDVETFCKDEGRLLLGCPSLHVALVGSALRVMRFRAWRRLFARATLFRLRYQLRFMRIYRPRWLTKDASPLGTIVQDTAHAARSIQGLVPDLCHQAALVAGGCQIPYWSDCAPPPRVEKGWGVFHRLDRRLKQEFGTRARRVRPGDDYRLGPGLLGWRVPHRMVRGVVRVGGTVLTAPARRAKSSKKRPLRRAGRRRGRSAKTIDAEAAAAAVVEPLEMVEGSDEKDEGVVVEALAAVTAEEDEGAAESGSQQRQEEEEEEEEEQEEQEKEQEDTKDAWPSALPAQGPLIRFHNVTAIASRGSTLSKSYRALAELPYGDGRGSPDGDKANKPRSLPAWAVSDPDDGRKLNPEAAQSSAPSVRPPPALQRVVVKRNLPRQILLAEDDIAAAREVMRRMIFNARIDLDVSGVLAEVADAVARAGDLRCEAESIGKVRSNLARAGLLGSTVGVPEVVSCPELGPLARRGILVTTALRGVDVSDAYVMGHAAASGEKERHRFVDRVFAVFGQMCLADGCFPSNPMPDNLLYMYSGQVGLTDLSSVTQLTEDQRRALCRLYRTLADLQGEDAANPSAAAELKARAAMEGIGLVIDLPPAGGIAWASESSSNGGDWMEAEEEEEAAAVAVAAAVESVIDASLGDGPAKGGRDEEKTEEGRGEGEGEEGGTGGGEEEKADVDAGNKDKENEEKDERDEEEEAEEEEVVVEEEEEGEDLVEPTPEPTPPPPPPRPPLTHLMLLRGLFDTKREEALALVGGGGGQLLRGMAVRRLPQGVAPVLRMVANLRGVCAHLDLDKSLLPRFSRAASKGLSWRHALAMSRGGGREEGGGLGTPPPQASVVYQEELVSAAR